MLCCLSLHEFGFFFLFEEKGDVTFIKGCQGRYFWEIFVNKTDAFDIYFFSLN